MTVCLCHAAHGLSIVGASRVYSVVKYRLLIAVASLCCGAQALGSWASVVAAPGIYRAQAQ